MKIQLIWILAASLYFSLVSPITALKPGPIGYILHRKSRKVIGPLGDPTNVADDTKVVLLKSGFGQAWAQVQFMEVPGDNDFGFIRHVASGKYIHPLNGSKNPPNGNPLVWHYGAHEACLFKLDLQNDRIIQKESGKNWHQHGGLGDPPDNSVVVLNSDRDYHARFIFTNEQGAKIAPTCPSVNGCPCSF